MYGHVAGPDVTRFDQFARLYEVVMPPADPAVMERGLSYADTEIQDRLDVGGGTGRAAAALGTATVIDAANGMLRSARANGHQAVGGFAEQLPVQDTSVDAVTIVDALHHFAAAEEAIREATRVLRPGGVLVIRDFDPRTLRGSALVAIEHALGFDSAFYSSDDLLERLRGAGLAPFRPEQGFAYTVVGVKRRD